MKNNPHPLWNVVVFLPLTHFLFLLAFLPSILYYEILEKNSQGPILDSAQVFEFITYLPLINLLGLIIFFVTITYCIHRLYTATELSNESKVTWLVLLFIFNIITFPVLHFKHLRKQKV